MAETLYSNAVKYWQDGSTDIAPNPILASGQSKPFVVRIGRNGVIPCNVLVFAETGEQAEIRLLAALIECCEKDYRGRDGHLVGNASKYLSKNRAQTLISGLESGEYYILHCELDTQCMPSIQWACNGGIT
jgi:hypothetical protein